jgi:hypothetical protein
MNDEEIFRGGRRLMLGSLVVAAVGLIIFVVGLVVDWKQALFSYLIAYFYAITVILGLLSFVMGAHAMNATWPTAIRRVVEMGFAAMPVLGIAYIPLFWSANLYPWAHPETITDAATREIVMHKLPVMNPPLFYLRAVAFIVAWTVIAEVLRRRSLRMDKPEAPDLHDGLRGFSAVALPILGLTGTFAAFDWLMSLSPDFYSTMYGLYVLSGGFVASLGLIALLLNYTRPSGVRPSHWYAVGRLLFAFLIFWSYTGFFQYMLIWIANKPVEARFYIERFHAGDIGTSWFLVIGHFVVPWLVLLSYAVKRNPKSITVIGAWILLCHYVDIHWLVAAHRPGRPWSWQDLAPLLFIGGISVAFSIWRQRGHLIAARHDPHYAAATAYESR